MWYLYTGIAIVLVLLFILTVDDNLNGITWYDLLCTLLLWPLFCVIFLGKLVRKGMGK